MARFTRLLLLSASLFHMTSAFPPLSAATNSPTAGSPWKVLAPLPDRVGFAGMLAGVLQGRLVAAGGSQFPDKPLWQDGVKAYSDRIFVLPGLEAQWTESSDRLPQPVAHVAFGASADAIYFAGGCNASGVLRAAFVLRALRGGFHIEPLPDLPEPRVYASGVISRGRFFVAGGQAALGPKVASAEVWSLDITVPASEWRRESNLPEAAFVGAMAEHEGNVYFVGGVGFAPDGRSVQSRAVYRLAPDGRSWESLPPMPEPRVGPVTPAPVSAARLIVVGGYAAAFTGERREHPGFARRTFVFDIALGNWSDGPILPHEPPDNRDATGDKGPAPMVAAAGAFWQGHYVVVGGEVRASVRTSAVIALPHSVAFPSS